MLQSPPTTAIIIAAYQQAESLRLLLAALSAAPQTDFEVYVADDGSSPSMEELLAREVAESPFPVTFHWQPDAGFRKASILNATVSPLTAELLVFLDGDCIPHRDLIEVYRQAFQPREFFVGSVGFLEVNRSRALDSHSVAAGAHEGTIGFKQEWKIRMTHWKNQLYRGRKRVRPRIRGGNFAICSQLYRLVDGFDEVYEGHGKEDSDLRNRLRNSGAKGLSLWNRARAVHLSREVAPSGERAPTPISLYEEGRQLIKARRGLSAHSEGD